MEVRFRSALTDLLPWPPTFFCTKRNGTWCIRRRPGLWIGVLCRALRGVPMTNWILLDIALTSRRAGSQKPDGDRVANVLSRAAVVAPDLVDHVHHLDDV